MEYKEPDPNIDHLSDMQKIGIYPILPTAPTPEIQAANNTTIGSVQNGSAHSYRLQMIKEMQRQIEQEREKRSTLSKKYHRSVQMINILDNIMVGATMGLGVA